MKASPTNSPQRGATLLEYALLVALIALVAMAGMASLGQGVSKQFSDISGKIDGAVCRGDDPGCRDQDSDY